MQLGFGAGTLFGTPVADVNGNAIANPTPIKIGVMQECTIDIEFTTKQLYGANNFPVAIGRGQGKITGSAKHAQINGLMWSLLFFGQTNPALASGLEGVYIDTVGEAIPASTPYTITPSPPGSGTFAGDLGVLDSNQNPMTCVSGTPTTGQYAVASGVYTFAAADEGKTVFINYAYTETNTTPFPATQTIKAQLMGYSPVFSINFSMQYKGSQLNFKMYQATSSKLSMTTKLEDFLIPEFSFECFADSQNRVMDWSTSQ
jgi:hypothetical protein